MPGNANSGQGPKFSISLEEFKEHVAKYKSDCDEGIVLRPSLSHFCGRLETTEDYLLEWLDWGKKPGSTYYLRAEALRIFLTWLRGEMFSSGRYDGATAKKFVEMQLGRDHGDGVVYSSKPEVDNSPKTIKLMFGDNDKEAIEMAK